MNTLHPSTMVLTVLLVIYACSPKQQEENSGNRVTEVPVKLLPLSVVDTAARISATGTFTTDDETVLAFKNGGVIQHVHVKAGESFKRGQLLASLEQTEINTVARQYDLALEKAERDYARARQLYADSVATLEQFENAKTALDAARQDKERIGYQQGHAAIYAPFDGFVLQRSANSGQIVGPGTPVFVVSSTGRGGWFLKIGVSDRQWAAIREGDRAHLTADVFGNDVVAGIVARKSEGIDPGSGTFTVYVRVVGNSLPGLASGMFGKATLDLPVEAGVWMIPYEALLDGDAGKGYVFVTNDGITAQRIEVEIGELQKDRIVITGGLEQAKSLIVSGSPYLRDGSTITVK